MAEDWTSITIRDETKAELEQYRDDGESWDAFCRRWIADKPPEHAGVDRLLDEISQLPTRTADELEGRLR